MGVKPLEELRIGVYHLRWGEKSIRPNEHAISFSVARSRNAFKKTEGAKRIDIRRVPPALRSAVLIRLSERNDHEEPLGQIWFSRKGNHVETDGLRLSAVKSTRNRPRSIRPDASTEWRLRNLLHGIAAHYLQTREGVTHIGTSNKPKAGWTRELNELGLPAKQKVEIAEWKKKILKGMR